MSEENKSIAEMVRNGSYFQESRAWYAAMYFAPISERAFFAVVACLATIIGIVGFVALLNILPLVSRPGVIIPSARPFETHPRLSAVKESGAAVEPAMEKKLLSLYVSMREGYEVSRYASNYAFVIAHSDPSNAQAYAQLYTSSNPKSLAAILGYSGQRLVSVDNIRIDAKAVPRKAFIGFTTELINVSSGNSKTRWTAELNYNYTPLTVTETKDAKGDFNLSIQDPKFQVVGYVVTQTP